MSSSANNQTLDDPGLETIGHVEAPTVPVKTSKKAFMLDFDSDLIFKPGTRSNLLIPGVHPEWLTVAKTQQLYDPIEDRLIAVWDEERDPPQIYFFGKGLFRKHPTIAKKYTFVDDANYDPYKPKKGKCIFIRGHFYIT